MRWSSISKGCCNSSTCNIFIYTNCCANNVNYFFAVAALRDDTDDYQWLVNDDHTYWERKETICKPSKYMQLEGHKATLEEIVELYKDKPFSLV